MSKEVVLDIETQNSIADVGGMNYEKFKISLIGVYFYETDEYASYLEHELHELWPRLERADRIIGYNTKGFDYPIMNNYYTGNFSTFPSLDIMEVIAKTIGFRVKLDDVAMSTLGTGKTGHGLQAIEFFKKGEMDKLRDYCLMDVRVTKEVYDHGKLHKQISFTERNGLKRSVPVDFSIPEKVGGTINLTLGF